MTAEYTNIDLANGLRTAANEVSPEEFAALITEIGGSDILFRVATLLAADLLELHEENGVDLNEWDAAMALVKFLTNGPPYERQVKKPQLVVAGPQTVAAARNLRV